MSLAVEIKLSPGIQEMIARCQDSSGMGSAVAKGMDVENVATVELIHRKLSGWILNRRTGRLRNSMQSTGAVVVSTAEGFAVHASIGSNVKSGGGAVKYAAIHEFGGTILHESRKHTTRLRITKSGRLSRNKSGGARFAKLGERAREIKTRMPSMKIEIPKRAYLWPSILERMSNLTETVSGNIVKFIAGKGGDK